MTVSKKNPTLWKWGSFLNLLPCSQRFCAAKLPWNVKEDKINKLEAAKKLQRLGGGGINSINSVRAEGNIKVLFLGSKAVSVGAGRLTTMSENDVHIGPLLLPFAQLEMCAFSAYENSFNLFNNFYHSADHSSWNFLQSFQSFKVKRIKSNQNLDWPLVSDLISGKIKSPLIITVGFPKFAYNDRDTPQST